jgi:hypothetical protein
MFRAGAWRRTPSKSLVISSAKIHSTIIQLKSRLQASTFPILGFYPAIGDIETAWRETTEPVEEGTQERICSHKTSSYEPYQANPEGVNGALLDDKIRQQPASDSSANRTPSSIQNKCFYWNGR